MTAVLSCHVQKFVVNLWPLMEFELWWKSWQWNEEQCLVQLQMAYIDGLVQDCSNSSALAMELLQSCTEVSILWYCMKNFGKVWSLKRESVCIFDNLMIRIMMFKWDFATCRVPTRSLFPGKVHTFDHGSLGPVKVLSFSNSSKRSWKSPYFLIKSRLMNLCLM